MKSKHIAALFAASTVVSCSPLNNKGHGGGQIPKAIPVYDSSPIDGIITGLKNAQELAREGATTVDEARRLGDAFRR